MKSSIFFAFVLSSALPLCAPADPAANTVAAPVVSTENKVNAPDGIARVHDATVYIKDGNVTRVNNELKLSEGMTAAPSGAVTLSDGKTIKLEEGQMVTLKGEMMAAPIGLGSTAVGSASTQPQPVPAPAGNGAPVSGK